MHWNLGESSKATPTTGVEKLLRRVSRWWLWLTTPESIPDGLVGGRNKHVIWDIVKNESVLHCLYGVCVRGVTFGRIRFLGFWASLLHQWGWLLRSSRLSVRMRKQCTRTDAEKTWKVSQFARHWKCDEHIANTGQIWNSYLPNTGFCIYIYVYIYICDDICIIPKVTINVQFTEYTSTCVVRVHVHVHLHILYIHTYHMIYRTYTHYMNIHMHLPTQANTHKYIYIHI